MTAPVPSPAVQRVLDRLVNVRPDANGWVASCPCPGHTHGDAPPAGRPSLGIAVGREGQVLLSCRSQGHKYGEIMRAIDLREQDGFAEEARPRTKTTTTTRTTASTSNREGRLPDLEAYQRECDEVFGSKVGMTGEEFRAASDQYGPEIKAGRMTVEEFQAVCREAVKNRPTPPPWAVGDWAIAPDRGNTGEIVEISRGWATLRFEGPKGAKEKSFLLSTLKRPGTADGPGGAAVPFEIFLVGDPATEPKEEPPPPIVEGLIHSGFATWAGAPKKSKKTLLATYLAMCVHWGLPFFGRPVRRLPVLFVQRDMGKPWFVQYVRMIRQGMGLPPAEGIPVVACPLDLMKPADQERLRMTIAQKETKVLIIDSSRSTSTVEENFSEEVRKITRDLMCDQLRDEQKLEAIILVTHVAKGGNSARGTGEWGAAGDSNLVFAPEKSGKFVTVTGDGRHADLEFSFKVEAVDEAGKLSGFRLVEVSEVEAGQARRKQEKDDGQERLKALALAVGSWNGPPLTKTDLVARAKQFGLRGRGTKMDDLIADLKTKFRTFVEKAGKQGARLFEVAEIDRDIFRREFQVAFREPFPSSEFGNESAWE